MAMNKNEFRQELTDRFVQLLEEKDIGWVKEWSTISAYPMNGKTEKEYRGINMLMLMITMQLRGWKDPRFFTFKQIQELQEKADDGNTIHLQKGSKGVHVEYWFLFDKKAENNSKRFISFPEGDALVKKGIRDHSDLILRSRYYTVFNGDQIEGIQKYDTERKTNENVSYDQLVDKAAKSMNVTIEYNDGDRCYYRPKEDKIYLPKPEYFNSQYAFTSTAFHELGHSTGAPGRLNRRIENIFASGDYAAEELVAELTSCFISADIKRPEDDETEYWEHHFKNHAGYVQGWARSLKEDINALPRAIKAAEQASDYLEMHAGIISKENYEKKYSQVDTEKYRFADELRPVKELNTSKELMRTNIRERNGKTK